jgi:hypothetical protein
MRQKRRIALSGLVGCERLESHFIDASQIQEGLNRIKECDWLSKNALKLKGVLKNFSKIQRALEISKKLLKALKASRRFKSIRKIEKVSDTASLISKDSNKFQILSGIFQATKKLKSSQKLYKVFKSFIRSQQASKISSDLPQLNTS